MPDFTDELALFDEAPHEQAWAPTASVTVGSDDKDEDSVGFGEWDFEGELQEESESAPRPAAPVALFATEPDLDSEQEQDAALPTAAGPLAEVALIESVFGRQREAIALWERCLEADPENPNYRWRLEFSKAQVHIEAGNLRQAQRHLEVATGIGGAEAHAAHRILALLPGAEAAGGFLAAEIGQTREEH